MSAGFTPGPWFHVAEDEAIITEDGGKIVYELNTNEADGHLIAAAPDLYEVVERLNASGHAISQPLRWEMQAALAKARGETA